MLGQELKAYTHHILPAEQANLTDAVQGIF